MVQFTCFTGTNTDGFTAEHALQRDQHKAVQALGSKLGIHFTFFTGTKVKKTTQKALHEELVRGGSEDSL